MDGVSVNIQSIPHATSTSRLMETQSSRNEDWNIVQRVVLSLFQQKSIGHQAPIDFHELNQKLLNLMKTEIAPFLGAYYQEQLLKRGMIVMREAVREESGQALLNRLEGVWQRFFSSILPSLQMIFFPLTASQTSSGMSIRNMSLVGFRDIIVMKMPILEALQTPGVTASPVIQQMLLILWSVREKDHPTETYLKLEDIVSCAVSPFLKTGRACRRLQSERAKSSPKLEKSGSSTLPRNMSAASMMSRTIHSTTESFEAETDASKSRGKTFSGERGSFPPSEQQSLRRNQKVVRRNSRPTSTKSSQNVGSDLGTLEEQRSMTNMDQPDAAADDTRREQLVMNAEDESGSSGETHETNITTVAMLPSSVHSTGSYSSGPEPKTPVSVAEQNSPELGSLDQASLV